MLVVALLQVASPFAATRAVTIKAALQGPAAEDESSCLLQNQFAHGDIAVEEDSANTELHANALESRLLFQGESFEVANMMSIKQRSVARTKSCMAHLVLLDRKTRVLEISRNISNQKLDDLVDGFINHQSGSEDACSSQLMEAKHQLNQIHQYVIDLSMEINATEKAITALDKELQDLINQMEELEKWKEEQLGECATQMGEAEAMFGKISDEMKEMQEIASPSVAMDIHTGTIETAVEEASELQTSVNISPHRAGHSVFAAKVGHRNMTKDMERLGLLAQGTQAAVSQYLTCMGPERHKRNVAALLADFHNGSGVKHFWTKGTVDRKCPGKSIGSLKTKQNTIAPCKRKCEQMKRCRGFNRGKRGAVQAQCFFFSSCTAETPKGKLEPDKNFNAYFITATMQFTGPGKGKNRMGMDASPLAGPLDDAPLEGPLDDAPLEVADDEPLIDPAPPKEAQFRPGTSEECSRTNNVKLMLQKTPEERYCRFISESDGGKSVCNKSYRWNGGAQGITRLCFWDETAKKCKGGERVLCDFEGKGDGDGEGEGEDEVPTPEECEAEKENLHKVYVKTYVELSRLKDEYNELANSTACKDGTLSEYESKKNPLQEKIDELLKKIDEKVKKLQSLRPRLESALEAERKMREQIKRLASECGELPETISDLGKVRDAIQALARCPGLSRVEFHLPKWTGTWVTFKQDAATMNDTQQDALMDAACDKSVAGTRAAEVGEIEEQTVEGIPTTNTAEVPLLGACPHCEGNAEASYVDKHARLCWPSGKALNHKDKRKNCGTGLKAILCVSDQGDIRNIPT